MSTLRSESMIRGTLVVPSSLPMVHELLSRIGALGVVEFIDMHPDNLAHRPYNVYIQRIEEMERIIRYLYDEIANLEALSSGADVDAVPGELSQTCSLVMRAMNGEQSFMEHGNDYVLERVEDALNRLYAQFVRFNANNKNLLSEKFSALEEKYVLLVARQQYTGNQQSVGPPTSHLAGVRQNVTGNSPSAQEGLLLLNDSAGGARDDSEENANAVMGRQSVDPTGSVSSIAGVVKCSDIRRLQGMLFRATRGNAFCFFQSIDGYSIPDYDSELTGGQVNSSKVNSASNTKRATLSEKTVFVVYYQGTTQSQLHAVVKNIVQAFTNNLYSWPASLAECEDRLVQVENVLLDKSRAVSAYERYFLGEISTLLECARPDGSSLIEEWKMFCRKEKAIYATLNYFEGQDVTLRCMCWIPTAREAEIKDLVKQFEDEHEGNEQGSAVLLVEKFETPSGNEHGGNESPMTTPPTYFKATEFTEPSQMLVDTYGVPRYKEANPAYLTTVTFPFLFGVMYGDAGHGGIVLLLGLHLWLFNERLKKQEGGVLKSLAPYRYMLTMMGAFAFFGGFMYNDVFALGIDIFGSQWTYTGSENIGSAIRLTKAENSSPYPFGLDPAWKGAINELLMTNSIKMKLSVLIGFFHMFVGVILSGMNNIYNKNTLDFICEFIPKVIFIVSVVGYLDFLVVYKWLLPNDDPVYRKPNIISTIINMFMLGSVKPEDQLFHNEQLVERILFAFLILSIPAMLLIKPIVLIRRLKKHPEPVETQHTDLEDPNSIRGQSNVDTHESKAESGASDIFIYQMIETIEFVLGTISNTASYLRLWALSLAHQQLSLVFYSQLIVRGLTMSDNIYVTTIALFIVYVPFAFITFGVILCMDLLEVSLHALRLQWVEFQNKFFKGDGRRFQPLSVKAAITCPAV